MRLKALKFYTALLIFYLLLPTEGFIVSLEPKGRHQIYRRI